jgi:hypothetical protein
LACSNDSEYNSSPVEPQNEMVSNDNKEGYKLIRDNLYSDSEGTLYLRSRTREYFESGKWIDFWIKTVYCDSCWTPAKNGWKDITELKDFVDLNSFHLDTTNNVQGGDFYEDNNYTYFHKFIADGGTITRLEK